MRLKTAQVVIFVCTITWGGLGAAQETTGDSARSIWLVDDFEDQNLDGWAVPTGPCNATIAALGAAGTNYSLAVNGACGHDGGTSYDLGGSQATGVSLYVRPSGSGARHLYVVLDDDGQATNGYIVAFLATNDGWFSVDDSSPIRFDLMVNDDLDWHDLQLFIDWIGKNVDVVIDGVPRQYNLPFAVESISTLRFIHLYNLDMASAWYDQIALTGPPPSLEIMTDDFESADESGWTTAVPGLPQRLVLYSAGGTAGAIGGRGGADVLCGQAALGMPGIPLHATTRAFISVDGYDSIANMPTNFGVPTGRKVTGPNLIKIADDWADLMDGTIDISLIDADIIGPTNWYSGSFSDGTTAGDTCSGWTDGSGSSGRFGYHGSTTSTWISSGSSICGVPLNHVLCLAWR
jgi:hypothetical protein